MPDFPFPCRLPPRDARSSHRQGPRGWTPGGAGLALLLSAVQVQSQVITDGSLGAAQTLAGPQFQIGEDLGTRVGDNLFHSFSQFSIASGASAHFSGDPAIRHVISRVTGGQPSQIDGLLQSDIGSEGFWLLNPAGVAFGTNARIDLPGQFHVASADRLMFSDGQTLSASTAVSRLSIAAPESFGFLESNQAQLRFDGSTLELERGGLHAHSRDLQLLDSHILLGGEDAAQLQLQGDRIQLISSQISQTHIGANAAGQGIRLEGGQITLQDSQIEVSALGSGPGPEVQILASGQVSLEQTSRIDTYGYDGEIGGILIQADSLDISGLNSGIASLRVEGNGGSRDILIELENDLRMTGDVQINSDTFSSGEAGDIRIHARNLTLGEPDNPSGGMAVISSDTINDQSNAGAVLLSVDDRLSLYANALISSNTLSLADGGRVTVDAREIRIDGRGAAPVISGIASGISTSSLAGTRGEQEFAEGGDAGAIEIHASEGIELIAAGIASDSRTTGAAGTIAIDTGALRLEGVSPPELAEISSRAGSASPDAKDAGTIRILAETIQLEGDASISTNTAGGGNAGTIDIRTNGLTVNGSTSSSFTGISSAARGSAERPAGGVGSIGIQAERIELSNGGSLSVESTHSNATSQQQQQISIDTDSLRLREAEITAAADGNTESSDILINASGQVDLLDHSRITTASENADAGEVRIQAERLQLRASQITTSVSGVSGNGGDIDLQLHGLILDKGFIQANTAARGNASGGDIRVDSPYLLVPGNQTFVSGGDERLMFEPSAEFSVIQAAAPDGVSGQVELEIPEVDLAASILEVDAGLAELSEISPNACQRQLRKPRSSLSQGGRGALPADLASSAISGLDSCEGTQSRLTAAPR